MSAALGSIAYKDTKIGSTVTRMSNSTASYNAWKAVDEAAGYLESCMPDSLDASYYKCCATQFLEAVKKVERCAPVYRSVTILKRFDVYLSIGRYSYMPEHVNEKITELVVLLQSREQKNGDGTITTTYGKVNEWSRRATQLRAALLDIKPV